MEFTAGRYWMITIYGLAAFGAAMVVYHGVDYLDSK